MKESGSLSEVEIFNHLLELGENTKDQGAVTACVVRDGNIIFEATSIDVGLIIHAEHRVIGLMDRMNELILPTDTLYTTLEPCSARFDSSRGIQDCTSILLGTNVKQVVFAACDPIQSKLTQKRFSVAGIHLRQVEDTVLIERSRELFNNKVVGYKV